jgi:putative transposase
MYFAYMTNIEQEQTYHVYNRGVLKMTLFKSATDYLRFILKMSLLKKRYPVDILCYCIMPNHFHLLIREPETINDPTKAHKSNISCFLQQLQNSYAKYFSIKYQHSGRVFQGVFKRKLIENESYYLQIKNYIHQNPTRKHLTKTPEEWPYSSASNPDL